MLSLSLRRLSTQLSLIASRRNAKCLSSRGGNYDNGDEEEKEVLLHYNEDDHRIRGRSGVGVIIMKRLRYKNALGHVFMEQFREILDRVKLNSSLDVLIVTSAIPGVFCAGADLRERAEMSNRQVSAFTNMLRATFMELENLPMPTIAAIDGAALGGGLEMALACDIRIADSNAKMGLIETSRALIPGAGGTQRLPRLVGRAKAKELILTSRILDGCEAEKVGVVNHCIQQNSENDAAFHKALELADEMSTRGPIALKMAKAAINRGIDIEIEAGMKFEEAYYAQVIPTKDRREGMAAFLEKREPKYKGH